MERKEHFGLGHGRGRLKREEAAMQDLEQAQSLGPPQEVPQPRVGGRGRAFLSQPQPASAEPDQPRFIGRGLFRQEQTPAVPSTMEGKVFLPGRGSGRGPEVSAQQITPAQVFGAPTIGGRAKNIFRPPSLQFQEPQVVLRHEDDVPPAAKVKDADVPPIRPMIGRSMPSAAKVVDPDVPAVRQMMGRAKMRQHLFVTSPAAASLARPSVPMIPIKDDPSSDDYMEVDESLSVKTATSLASKLTIGETKTTRQDAPPVIMMGTSGQKLNVVCNYIKFLVEPGKGVFLHEVIFKPEVDAKKYRFQLVKMLEDKIGATRSFDGGSLMHLPHALKNDVIADLKMPTDGSDVRVTIKFVRQFSATSDEVIRLYNVLFRKIMVKLGLVLHGQNFFNPHSPSLIPAHKLELWPGFITAIHEYEGGVMLNCDASYRALRTETVWQLLQDRAYASKIEMEKVFQASVSGLVVLTRYNNKIYRVDDIDLDRTPKSTFKRKDGSEITYIEYYKNQYDITIKDVNQPLLKSLVKNRIKGEEVSAMVDLIPELCYLSGLNDELRQDMRIMKDVASHTRISPAQRKKAMNEFLNNIRSKPEAREVLEQWGLKLDKDLVDMQARRLDPEEIVFGKGAVQKGNLNADWSKMATTSHVQCPIDLNDWAVVCTQRDLPKVQDFVDMAIKCGRQMGINIQKPAITPLANDSTNNYLIGITNAMKNNSLLQIVVVVLPMARLDKYSAVKKTCCISNPIPSQVILTRTLSKPDKLRSVTQKIVLQMNCKVGGTLWSVNIPLKKAMIVGLDAYHDPTRKGSSVGAIVASFDAAYTKWYSQAVIQSPGQELMNSLEEAFLKCLSHYKDTNGELPETVVVYRDGVSDGQLNVCENHEIPQLISAMMKLKSGYSPKFVFVVVQKRINTRVFAKERNQLNNPPPGTVVDHTVTRRHLFDFFVVSQSVRQGTATPTHYIVLFNSSQMKADHIQRLSYKLSHLYYNWCGTVRVPAPCQYAHKLATLIGEAVRGNPDRTLLNKLFFL